VLDINSHQGKFGEDYVRVLASAAGLVVYKAAGPGPGLQIHSALRAMRMASIRFRAPVLVIAFEV
jgi:hypothetical protein